jgi:hypothetical protein
MKKLLLFAAGLVFFCEGKAQIVYESNKFTLTTTTPRITTDRPNPPLIARDVQASPSNPGTAFMFEYGDGYFTTEMESVYYYKDVTKKYNSILTLSGRYDTIRPPRIMTKIISPDPQLTGSPIHQPVLNSTEMIKITPIGHVLNPRKEILFIITYRIPQTAINPRLYFFYNHFSFNMMEPADNTSILQLSDVTGDAIPRIRTHFGESWDASATTINTIVPKIDNSSFLNILAWKLDPLKTTDERNIFVTLRTKDNIPLQQIGLVEAALVYLPNTDPNTRIKYETSPIKMVTSADPEDPNSLTSTPPCLIKNGWAKTALFNLHFQNEGQGPAYRIHIDLVFDKRLAEAIKSLKPSHFLTDIGKKRTFLIDYKLNDHIISFDIISLKYPPGTGLGITLSGNKIPHWHFSPLTIGEIYFNLAIPNIAQADFSNFASIVLYNWKNEPMPAVNTKTSMISVRDSCNYNIIDRLIHFAPRSNLYWYFNSIAR